MSTTARATTDLPRQAIHNTQRVELYDRYGSVAYGIILQIVPQPELAQAILVDLFATLPTDGGDESERMISRIIRLARDKALTNRHSSTERSLTSFHPTERNIPKVVFNLAFWHGCRADEIAERLNIAKTDVLRAIRTYVKSFKTA